MKPTSQIIQEEADECRKSAGDVRNTPEHREIFYVVAIVLDGIAKKLKEQEG